MSYTPTNWTTGDTITAAKLNKMEQGIANAGGGEFAVVELSATGFNSATHDFGYIVYAYRKNNTWVTANDVEGNWTRIWGFSQPFDHIIPPQNTFVSADLCPFLVSVIADEINTTGGISDTPENLYLSYGSLVAGDCYRISGSGSIEFVAG